MNTMPVALLSIVLVSSSAPISAGAGQATGTSQIVGAWALNKSASDTTAEQPGQQRGEAPARRGGGGGRGRGGFSGGGFGRGRGGGGGANPEEARRRAEAVRTIMEAPERLTITQTDSLVIIVDGDGRTTRLSPDGKKIKDDATGIERKTKWDGDKLVSEITGAGPGKITETYAADASHARLTITLETDNPRNSGGSAVNSVHRIYDRLQDR